MVTEDRVVSGPTRRRLRFADDRLFFWVSFTPTAVITGTVVLLPILYTLILSLFSQNTLVGSPIFVGLRNYLELLQDPVTAAQKVGEEATEVVIAALVQNDDRLLEEIADLVYHTLVLLSTRDLNWEQVVEHLEQRHRK